MKKYDLVSILGAAACIALLAGVFVWNYKHPPRRAVPPQAPAPAAASQAVASAEAGTSAATTGTETAKAMLPATPAQVDLERAVKLAVPGEFTATIDANGRGVAAVEMAKHKVQSRNAEERKNPLVMRTRGNQFLSLGGITLYNVADGLTQGEREVSVRRVNADTTLEFTETWKTGPGSVPEHDYEITYVLKIKNNGDKTQTLNSLTLDCGELQNFISDEQNTSNFLGGIAGSVAYGAPGSRSAELLSMKDLRKKMDAKRIEKLASTPAAWVAVDSRYFVFALLDVEVGGRRQNGFAGVVANCPNPDAADAQLLFHAAAYLPELKLGPKEETEVVVHAYAGPKRLQRLQKMDNGIDSIMGMDYFFFWHFRWMGWLGRLLLESLNLVARIFGGAGWAYGIGIILVTLVVKLIFMPLAWKSSRSMKAMSALQPQLKALREKYKDDPQHMYYEQQKLFKENNVSQFGGCLPMLVQIPVFFAMYNTFRAAFEIRNASFLWVADLSMPDRIFNLPIHPLALLTGVTMYLQQRLTPMPDPQQARMMNIMSLVFIVFFYNMPAGLTLYMTVNQLFSIVQMYFFRQWEKSDPLPATTAK